MTVRRIKKIVRGIPGPTGATGPIGPAAVWGLITGTLANQTDLLSELVSPGQSSNFYRMATTPTGVPTAEGIMSWSSADGVPEVQLQGGVTGQMFEELFYPKSINTTASEIANGKCVMFEGVQGDQLKVALADVPNLVSTRYMMGIATETIAASGGQGRVTWFGRVRGVNTTGTPYGEVWTIGDELFATGSTGGLTNVKPTAPTPVISMAVVERAHATTGRLMVRPWLGSFLSEISDVLITSPSTFDILQYNASTLRWENVSAATQNFQVITGAHTLTSADINYLSVIDNTLTLPQTSTEAIAEDKKAWFQAYVTGDVSLATEGVERFYPSGTSILAGKSVIIFRHEWFPADKAETSGDTASGVEYEIAAQSLVDFTSIGAADNNVGTQFTSTGIVTMTAADSLIPKYHWYGQGALA